MRQVGRLAPQEPACSDTLAHVAPCLMYRRTYTDPFYRLPH